MRINLFTPDNMYSDHLSGDSLYLYKEIINSLSKGDLTISCEVSNPNEINDNIDLIGKAVFEGNPELFFVEQVFAPSFSGNRINLTLKPCYDMSTINEKYDALCKEIDRIVEIISKIPNKIDQLYRLNEYLCIRIETSSNTDWAYGNSYGALISCCARCEGFAKAAKMILNKLGFENEIIVGNATHNGQNVVHAWNEIKVNGKNYYFDFTWNAGYSANQKIAIPLYTFLDRNTMLISHEPFLLLDNDNDNSMLFWKLHNGELQYLSDLSSADVIPYDIHYFAIARFPFELSQYEIDYELYQWAENAFGCSCFATQTFIAYDRDLKCGIIYFLNS